MTIAELFADPKYPNKSILQKLIMHYCQLTREQIRLHLGYTIPHHVLDAIISGYEKYTIHKMPLEYIVGHVRFLGYTFAVNQHTLIPRPETEYMILAVNQYVQSTKPKNMILLDIGTGCGVLGLSVLLHNPNVFSQAILSDCSIEALRVAEKNYLFLKKYLPSISLIFIASHLLDFLENFSVCGEDVLLVANLPYIPDNTFDSNVDETVKKWEPRIAFVGGEDGLDLYRMMLKQIIALFYSNKKPRSITLFLEMMAWQVDKLCEEFSIRLRFQELHTFHFNIKIVQVLPNEL